ncbi:MAG: 16S rRNA (guanine(966)-N(2))-methyltransferase RsmD [Arsenophonus sp.]
MAKKNQYISRGKIRIIGGKWRGRKLDVFDSNILRPTTNINRETLFNWLMPVVKEARCLDCFAGSGALAIEALSRYTASATLVELEHSIATQLISNLAKLEETNAKVINDNILNYLRQTGTAHDIIFLDPPFRKNLLKETALLLEQNGWLTENCWIYVEAKSETNLSILPKNWALYRKKISKKVACCIYIRNQ